MIRLIKNILEGQSACPKNYPVTPRNPAPWKITEMTIDDCWRPDRPSEKKVYIRGEDSMWFKLDDCVIGEYNELKDWLDYKTEQEHIEKSISTHTLIV